MKTTDAVREARKFNNKRANPVHRNSFGHIREVFLEATASDRADKTRRAVQKMIAEIKAERHAEHVDHVAKAEALLAEIKANGFVISRKPSFVDAARLQPITVDVLNCFGKAEVIWRATCYALIRLCKADTTTHYSWEQNWIDNNELVVYVAKRMKKAK
jgi:hypothetical protein